MKEEIHEKPGDIQAIIGDNDPGVSGSLHGLRRHVPAHPRDPLQQRKWSLDLVFLDGVKPLDAKNESPREIR